MLFQACLNARQGGAVVAKQESGGQPMATQAVKKQPRYILLVDWNRKYDWPTQGGLRHLMQYRTTNGFASAFVKVGNRVLVDETKFFECVARRAEWEACDAAAN